MPGRAGQTSVLIAGGGVAALEATLALRALAEERVTIELVAPDRHFVYRPLAVAEPFGYGEVRRFPLRPLVEAAGASLRPESVTAVDVDRYTVRTSRAEHRYDVLLLALGARPEEAVPGASTFRGPQDGPVITALLEQAVAGEVRSVVFAAPPGVGWSLPVYELALLTANYLTDRMTSGVEVSIVTPEEAPLALFGPAAATAMRELLELRGIGLRTGATPVAVEDGVLRLAPSGRVEADRVVALPRLRGPALPGVASDANGFVPTDESGRVTGEVDVYAAGDLTQFPLKQGGIAAQQADAAAEAIAAHAGAPVKPKPFKPILRGQLLTGMTPLYLRAEPGSASSVADAQALWWPPAKIVGRYLAPFLAAQLGLSEATPPVDGETIPVEVELDPSGRGAWSPLG
jgi:sulfide:quinone oxidoreductase